MKAILFKKYGPPETLSIEEIKKPHPKDHEVLVRILATTITAGVALIRQANMLMLRIINGPFRPLLWKKLGIEFSGVVEQVGKKVTRFKEGDEVFGTPGMKMGAFAEYICLGENKAIEKKPALLSWQEAAAIPVGAYTALHFLRNKANIKEGQKVLIYGASGSVGSYGVQLAKYLKTEVTGVCSTPNVHLIKSIGADSVIDYKNENARNEYGKYDIIFDAVGKTKKKDWKDNMLDGCKFVSVNDGLAKGKPEYLSYLREVAESGGLKPLIDKVYPFEEIADAFRYVEQGHKKGNVVINVVQNN